MTAFQRLVEALQENLSSQELRLMSTLGNEDFQSAVQLALEDVDPDYEQDDLGRAEWAESLQE